MTLLVGILCREGVVIASDSAATFGANGTVTIGQQEVEKVRLIHDKIAYAATGAVGIAQLIIDAIARSWSEGKFTGAKTPEEMMGKVGHLISNTVGPFLNTAQLQRQVTGEANASLCKSLIAMPVCKKFQLFQFDFNGAPEMCTHQLPFVALGSGQMIADPFLALLKRLLWPNEVPSLADGRLAAVWTIDHVRRTSPGGVGGRIQLATLTNNPESVKIAQNAEVDEHLQAIEEALSALVAHIKGEKSAITPQTPPAFPAIPAA